MVKRRPHIMYATTAATQAHQDNDGNWIPGNPGVEITQPCRYEPNGAGRTINGPDGNTIVFNGIVYLDKGAVSIPVGAQIVVKEGEEIVATGKALRYSAGQMNSRLWV